MSLIERSYPDIVRDLLTNLTQGVSREVHRVTYDATARPLVPPEVVLARRPVRRVSLVTGFVAAAAADEPPIPYTFTLNDYELVGSTGDPDDLNTIRFLPFGRLPAPDTDITVNYYPRTTERLPITDLNVGSVARTLVEALSKELALLYAQLNLAYDSAFVETAAGASLDRVVALLSYERFRAGRPVGTVVFRRRGTVGNITIPAGTPVTDAEDKVRYETVDTYTMLAGESVAEVRVRGASAITPPVEAGKLTVIQRAIAGIDSVINERPTTRAAEDESDEDLRGRVRSALIASNKGTVASLTHGLLQMPQVRGVKIDEMPNGVAGEIRVSVSLTDPAAGGTLPQAVADRIEELRPAGIRVLSGVAEGVQLAAQVQLVLAGGLLLPAEIEAVHRQVQDTLAQQIARRGVGETVRVGPLVAAILADERIVDVTLALSVKGQGAGQAGVDFQPPSDALARLDPADVVFAPDLFDQPAGAAGQVTPVAVDALIPAQPLTGVPIETVQSQIQARLAAFFGQLAAGATVESDTLLAHLRDDTKYAIDPLRLVVTLTTPSQFVQIAQGGQAFQVLPQHRFTLASVQVTA